MKKVYFIIILVILLIVCSIFFIVNKKNNENLEALEILENNIVGIKVIVDDSVNTQEMKNTLKNMKFVKSVELVSKDDALETIKDKFSNFSNVITNDIDKNIFRNSFIVKPNFEGKYDKNKIKILLDNIQQLNGIYSITASGFDQLMKVYEKKGIKGLREYSKILEIMDEQGAKGVTNYLDEHPETREILKDFVNF